MELAQKLIKLNPDIDIVFISGYAHDEKEIADKLGKNLKGFCMKPYDSDTLYRFLYQIKGKDTVKAIVRTFGIFDISLNGKSIHFSCAKSKELLAFIIEKNGANVPMDVCIAALWPDKPVNLSKRLYRDAVIRLKLTLKEHGLEDLVYFYRAELSINRERADCDLWRAQNTGDYSGYGGEYMIQYADWSFERQQALNQENQPY